MKNEEDSQTRVAGSFPCQSETNSNDKHFLIYKRETRAKPPAGQERATPLPEDVGGAAARRLGDTGLGPPVAEAGRWLGSLGAGTRHLEVWWLAHYCIGQAGGTAVECANTARYRQQCKRSPYGIWWHVPSGWTKGEAVGCWPSESVSAPLRATAAPPLVAKPVPSVIDGNSKGV